MSGDMPGFKIDYSGKTPIHPSKLSGTSPFIGMSPSCFNSPGWGVSPSYDTNLNR